MAQLLFMNGMGIIFYTLHMLFNRLEKKFMLPKYRLFMYRLNLMLFIIPFPTILFYMRRYFDSFVSEIPITPFYHNGSHIIFCLGENISFALPKLNYIQMILLMIWILAMIIISVYVCKEKCKIHRYDSYFRVFGEEEMAKNSIDVNSLLDAAMNEMNMKKKPRIYMHEKVSAPYVSGVFRPAIYLPSQWNVPEQVYYMTIKHELAHIKHKDLFFEYISQIAGIINCFNLLFGHMYSDMKTCEELAADACACEGASREDRNAYQTAILNLSVTDASAPNMGVRGLIFMKKHKDNTKERILTMKNKNLNKHKSLKLAVTTLMSIVIFSVSAIPALAYNLPSALEIEKETVASIDILDVDVLSTENDLPLLLFSSEPGEENFYNLFENIDFCGNDFICIDDYGFISYVTVDSPIIECNHNYWAARALHHDKNSDGSCTIIYYNAKRCSRCGQIVVMEEILNTTYNKCSH